MSSPEPDSSIVPQAIVRGRRGANPAASTGNRVRYRACLLCSYIQTSPQWMQNGCPNCDEVLNLKGDVDRIRECTSVRYDGIIALLKPDESWVGRWQRIGKFTKGLYAARVIGRLPKDAIEEVESKGFSYVPRDEIGKI